MSWTYSGDPGKSKKDEVRFLVGDTHQDEQLTTDEEIAWALGVNLDNAYGAASLIAGGIATYFSTLAESEEIGPIKVQYTNRVSAYTEKSKELARQASTTSSLLVYGGGIDLVDKESHAADTSLVKPGFTKGMTDFIATDVKLDVQ